MFQSPFSFEGRIRRTEYGISFIIYAVLYSIIRLFIESGAENSGFLYIALIPLLWFMWAQGAKRCHDIGRGGIWQIVPFYFLWLLFSDGQTWVNEYGENPKGIDDHFDYSVPDENNPYQRSKPASDFDVPVESGGIDLTKRG